MARYNSSYLDYIYAFSLPLHLFFFMLILFFVLGLSWYINYESVFEDFMNQVKFYLMLSPLILLLIVHCLSGGVPFFSPFPAEPDALHRAGGSPWGVAALLVLVLFMVSHQSSLHERWFPLITK
ncbi:hypothetical protein WN944_009188 [Citrus x changshan-huyou]|uniref:Transmembrane protein n=1 Tax=Citrus x changshan-huyou TaxID=2935761 RepID=A0AAP0MRC5_9ROSI